MRNVTITLEPEVARWARIKAAEQDTSVSRFVGELLKARMQDDAHYAAAMEGYLALPVLTLRQADAPLPRREELYDRDVFRRYESADLRPR